MEKLSPFKALSQAFGSVISDLPYYFKSLMFILPLAIVQAVVIGGPFNQVGIQSAIQGLLSLVFMVVGFVIYCAFAYGWYRKILKGEEFIQSPIDFSGHFTLFLKKTFIICLVVFLYFLGLAVPLSLIAFFLHPALSVILGIAGFIYILYLCLGYTFAMPAAALGLNMPIKEAKNEASGYIGGLFLSFLLLSLVGFIVGGISALIVGALTFMMAGSLIVTVIGAVLINIVSYFFTTVGIVIISLFYEHIFGEAPNIEQPTLEPNPAPAPSAPAAPVEPTPAQEPVPETPSEPVPEDEPLEMPPAAPSEPETSSAPEAPVKPATDTIVPPVVASAQAPQDEPLEMPTATPTEAAPVKAAPEAVLETPKEAPVQTPPAEAPMEKPAEKPVETPVEKPVEQPPVKEKAPDPAFKDLDTGGLTLEDDEPEETVKKDPPPTS